MQLYIRTHRLIQTKLNLLLSAHPSPCLCTSPKSSPSNLQVKTKKKKSYKGVCLGKLNEEDKRQQQKSKYLCRKQTPFSLLLRNTRNSLFDFSAIFP